MPAAEKWLGEIERGIGSQLHAKAKAARPSAIEIEAAPYLASFERQARTYAARAGALEGAGDHSAALIWAHEAERAASNLARIQTAIASALTSC